MTTLTEFPLFPHLPAELRLRIYALALAHPRILHLRTPDYSSNISYLPSPHPSLSSPPLNLSYSDMSWTTRNPPPPLLSVSHEARALALGIYTLKFNLLPAGPEIIYINPNFDIVFVHVEKWPGMLKVLLRDLKAFDVVNEGRGVTRMAVSTAVWRAWFDPGVNVIEKKRIEILEVMEEVVIVAGEGWEEEEGEGEGDGGVFLASGSDEEVICGQEGVLEGWKAAKDAGLGDGGCLRIVYWRKEEAANA